MFAVGGFPAPLAGRASWRGDGADTGTGSRAGGGAGLDADASVLHQQHPQGGGLRAHCMGSVETSHH